MEADICERGGLLTWGCVVLDPCSITRAVSEYCLVGAHPFCQGLALWPRLNASPHRRLCTSIASLTHSRVVSSWGWQQELLANPIEDAAPWLTVLSDMRRGCPILPEELRGLVESYAQLEPIARFGACAHIHAEDACCA